MLWEALANIFPDEDENKNVIISLISQVMTRMLNEELIRILKWQIVFLLKMVLIDHVRTNSLFSTKQYLSLKGALKSVDGVSPHQLLRVAAIIYWMDRLTLVM
ncbi:hypothetical protein ACFE04_025294 [Oxalis oulophora]